MSAIDDTTGWLSADNFEGFIHFLNSAVSAVIPDGKIFFFDSAWYPPRVHPIDFNIYRFYGMFLNVNESHWVFYLYDKAYEKAKVFDSYRSPVNLKTVKRALTNSLARNKTNEKMGLKVSVPTTIIGLGWQREDDNVNCGIYCARIALWVLRCLEKGINPMMEDPVLPRWYDINYARRHYFRILNNPNDFDAVQSFEVQV